MRCFKSLSVCFLVMFFVVFGFSQSKQGLAKYLRINVLVSTIADVETIYGKGETFVNKSVVNYKTSEDAIFVSYSIGNCQSKYPMWNVPDWTVEEVQYTPQKNPPKLKDLMPNKKLFKKRQSDHVIHFIDYYNDEQGITIYYDTLRKVVTGITIRPSLKDQVKYSPLSRPLFGQIKVDFVACLLPCRKTDSGV
jgi:hypothetical protein